MKPIHQVLIAVMILLAGCSGSKNLIEHPAPALKVDNSYFEGSGCFTDPACLPENLRNIEHPIDNISAPGDLLGALDPALPLAVASNRVFSPEDEIPAVYVKRCMAQLYVRYLVVVGDEMRLVDSVEGLASIYAPIDTPEETLSYAIASTGLTAVNDLHDNPRLKYYVASPEESFVKEVNSGYVVHLFQTYLCGCGPHIIKSVDVTVKLDGSISLSDAVETFSDPQQDGLCID